MSSSTTQLFSGHLRPFPGVDASWSAEKRAIASSILADVVQAAPDMLGSIVPDADIEDFWEDAARVSAAWRASGGDLETKDPGNWSADEMSRRIGPVTSNEEGGRHSMDRLIGHALVREHGGREMLLGSLGETAVKDDSTDILHWLAARHRDHGVQRGVVKAASTKGGIWSIMLDSDPEVISRRLLEAMDWGYMNLEGASNGVLAQDALELQYEYRLFVVDGEVVSGAGCVEEFTPLDRDQFSGPFDARVRRTRGHLHQGEPSFVEERQTIVAQLIEFGMRIAREHGGTFGLDVALDAGKVTAEYPFGTPVVIELNTIHNSGLYASDPWAVTAALVNANDRGYQLAADVLAGPATLVN